MPLTVTVTPGKQFAETETVTIAKLNQLGQPTFTVTGTTSTADVANGSITAAKTIADAHFYTASVSFSSGDYTLTYSPAITITDGCVIAFKANANGVPNVTTGIRLIIGASTKKLFKNKTQVIPAGDIVANQIIEARYDTAGDGGAGAWQMTSQPATAPNYFATAAGTDAYTLTLAGPPAPYAYALADLEGKLIRWKVPNANTTSVTLAITIGGSVLTATPVYKNWNAALTAGDLQKDQIVDVVLTAITGGTFAYLLQSPTAAALEAQGLTGVGRNFIAYNNVATPNTKIDITADEVLLKDATGRARRFDNINVTVDSAVTSAAFGRDYGGGLVVGWHYIWLINNGTTTAPLLSQSNTAPTMPSGYTMKGLFGAVYTNVAFTQFHQADRTIWIQPYTVFTGRTAGANDTYEILAGGDLTNFRTVVPQMVKTCFGNLGASNTTDACRHGICAVKPDGTLATLGIFVGETIMNQNGAAAALIGSFGSTEPFTVPVRGAGNYNIQWKATTNTTATRLTITGFTL